MMFSDVWSDNAAVFERLLEIHSNPPILYYGFKESEKKTGQNGGLSVNYTFDYTGCPKY